MKRGGDGHRASKVLSLRVPVNVLRRLREAASSRGVTVSDLIRSAAVRDLDGSVPSGTVASSSLTLAGCDLIWSVPPGSVVDGWTVTVR